MRITGDQAIILQSQTDSLTQRLLSDEGAELTITALGSTITIYDVGGTEIVAATSTGLSSSGAVATYSRTWTDTTFSRDKGYRARWSLISSATTYIRDQYFEVARRRFNSQLTDSDIPSSMRPSGVSSFQDYRKMSWEEITEFLWQKFKYYPGNLFFPEKFKRAHLLLTLAESYLSNSFDPGTASEDASKYEIYRERGLSALDMAASRTAIDTDDDGLLDEKEEQYSAGGIEIIR